MVIWYSHVILLKRGYFINGLVLPGKYKKALAQLPDLL